MNNLWQVTCAEPFDAPALEGPTVADLVIVGGGFTGCAAALQAAQLGARVVLLEANTIGYGGSGRNVGLVNAGLWLPPEEVERQMGRAAGKRLNAALAQGPDRVFELIEEHGITCEPIRNGTLHCAHTPKAMDELRDRLRQQRDRAAPVQLYDQQTTQQHTGSAKYFGALHDDRAGTVQPLAYAKGLARAARDQGAIVHEHSAVTDVVFERGNWTVSTAQGQVSAKYLIMANNAYGQDAARDLTPKTAVVNFFQLATDPLPHAQLERILPNQEGCWDTGLIMSSFRRDAAGRLIIGAMGRPDVLGLHRAWAERYLGKLYPELFDTRLTSFWSGRISMTADHVPKIQKLNAQGVTVFGYSGRGISPGTVFGCEIAKAMLTQDHSSLPIEISENYREFMPGMKSVYYETGARVMHGVLKR